MPILRGRAPLFEDEERLWEALGQKRDHRFGGGSL
jgi:hypothetical protein